MVARAKLDLFLIVCVIFAAIQISAQPAVTASKHVNATGSPADLPQPQPSAAPLPIHALHPRTIYTMDVIMDYAKHSVTIEQTIQYFNNTGTGLTSIMLAIPANLTEDCFKLNALSVNGAQTNAYKLEGHKLELPLPSALMPDGALQLNLRFGLSLPYQGRFNSLGAQLFGYTDVQANLVNWYPFVAPYKDGEWILNDPWYFGEYLVYPTADYTVSLLFIGQETNLVAAAGAGAERVGDLSRYTLNNARSFALSVSPYFQSKSLEANGVNITSYYLPAYSVPATEALRLAAQAVQVFEEQFGPYPYQSFSIIQADLNHTAEFSGTSFISRDLYQQYDGSLKNNFSFAVVHSAAHQWWGEAVGNDPANEPWLDEALATYAEWVFLEQSAPHEEAYWLKNQVEFFRPQGNVNATIYEALNYEDYRRAVYFNGVKFIIGLREQTGADQFMQFLRDYYQKSRGKIIRSEDFFTILDKHISVDYERLFRNYFK